MTTKIIYTLVSSPSDQYLQELWVSLYSIRLHEPDAPVIVLCDHATKEYIENFRELTKMITEIKVVDMPVNYNAKQRSRQLKTSFRQYVDGRLLFLDTDTVVCKPLGDLDGINCDIACVPEMHLPVKEMPYPPKGSMKQVFDIDLFKEATYYFNSGVILVDDNDRTHEFFRRWNESWHYSCFTRGNSQDEPAFCKTDIDMNHIIQLLPDIYNAQVAMSLKWFADAAIVHWWHMSFIEDQSYSPYFGGQIYQEIKEAGGITPHVDELIRHCKQSFVSPSMPVGVDQMHFLFTPAGKIFTRAYKNGGAASWLMNKLSGWVDTIDRLSQKHKKNKKE